MEEWNLEYGRKRDNNFHHSIIPLFPIDLKWKMAKT